MPLRILAVSLFYVFFSHALNAQEPTKFASALIDEGTVGLMRGAESNAFAAYSKTNKKWSAHTFPDHLTVNPSTLGEFGPKKNDCVVCFDCAGGTVNELVAIDCNGEFKVHKLKTPLNQDVKPVLNGGGVIYYIADEIVYAFSGKTGTWDTYQVPGLPNVNWSNGVGIPPDSQKDGFDTESENGIVVRRPIGTARFLADKGSWHFTPAKIKNGG